MAFISLKQAFSAALKACSFLLLFAFSSISGLSQSSSSPVIVQPGAPGQPTKQLPTSTRAVLPPYSAKNVEFMQGMIMHHAQAVEMTDMIKDRTKNKDITLIGTKISQSQSDEINFMKRWLNVRGEPLMPAPAHNAGGHSHGSHSAADHASMPGMLSKRQMADLKNASGDEFDTLFLKGMIQHHEGALVMVDDLFSVAGAGQDAEIFNFASDVDTGQRAEIRIMQTMLDNLSSKPKS